MSYKVIHEFFDMEDAEKHIYKVGDEYPRAGIEPSKERIAFLASAGNKIGTPVIEEEKKPAKKKAEKAD